MRIMNIKKITDMSLNSAYISVMYNRTPGPLSLESDAELEAFLELSLAERDSTASDGANHHERRSRGLVVTVECLHMLQKLPEAADTLRQEMPGKDFCHILYIRIS